MIVKVEIVNDVARMTSAPDEKGGIDMRVPASRVRSKFPAGNSPVLVGYFIATYAVTKDPKTGDEFPLDVVELGDRVPAPKVGW